jgi:hypothetical protein
MCNLLHLLEFAWSVHFSPREQKEMLDAVWRLERRFPGDSKEDQNEDQNEEQNAGHSVP